MSSRRRSIKRHGVKATIRNWFPSGTSGRGKQEWTEDEKERVVARDVNSSVNVSNEQSGRMVEETNEFMTYDVPEITDGTGDRKRSEIDVNGKSYSISIVDRRENFVLLVGELMR